MMNVPSSTIQSHRGRGRVTLHPSAVIGVLAVGIGLILSFPVTAAGWINQGPGPIYDGQTEGLENNPASGAISAIAPHPTDANILYVATVGGGIWKTSNARDASPIWKALTDRKLPSLATLSLSLSPLDPNILFVGTGDSSSYTLSQGRGFGLARSIDAGVSWEIFAADVFKGQRILSVVPTSLKKGGVLLAGTLARRGGVFRSMDGGSSLTKLSGDGYSGLPKGGVSALVVDPKDNQLLYAAVPRWLPRVEQPDDQSEEEQGSINTPLESPGEENSKQPGVYRSTDGGKTWRLAAELPAIARSRRILLAAHHSEDLQMIYAAVFDNNTVLQVLRSTNRGRNWVRLGLPNPDIFPGKQSDLHGAFSAHPTVPERIFISGDRQDPLGKQWPNAMGCQNYSSNTFSYTQGEGWKTLVCSGALGTSPHADARAMAFDSRGDLLLGTDGGLYRLDGAEGKWVSVNGNLRPTEFISAAYDPVVDVLFGGTQDNGTVFQTKRGHRVWGTLAQGDGGIVAIDADQNAHPGDSIRYSSNEELSFFMRTLWSSQLPPQQEFVKLNIVNGPGQGQTLTAYDKGKIQFYNPFVLNRTNPRRMLIGTHSLYESADRGDSLATLVSGDRPITALVYGGILNAQANPELIYAGRTGRRIKAIETGQCNQPSSEGSVLYRGAGAEVPHALSAYPGSGVMALAINPSDYRQVFVADEQTCIWGSSDAGATWQNLTGNSNRLVTNRVWTLEVFMPDDQVENAVLMAGGGYGIFEVRQPFQGETNWTRMRPQLPHVLVKELRYDAGHDVLVAATLGRGVWTICLKAGDCSVGLPENDKSRASGEAQRILPLNSRPPLAARSGG